MAIKVAVIINASAGSGHTRDWADGLTQQFRDHQIDAEVILADGGAAILDAALKAVDGDYAVVVAGGGDGTVNAVAGIVAGTGKLFGVLPLGTLNHFAKDLKIPLEIADAIANIAGMHCAKVDAASVNEKIFLNNSSLGLYPDVVRRREQQQRRLGRGKWHAFFWAMIASLRRYPFLDVTICIDGKDHHRRTPFVFIGNNIYSMEGLQIGQRERLDGGLLSFYVIRHTGRGALLMLALRALTGRLRQGIDVETVSTDAILIESRHKQLRVATDGEVEMMTLPLQYRSHPGMLSVIVPDNVNVKEETHAHASSPVGSAL